MIQDRVSQEAVDFILKEHYEGYSATAIAVDLYCNNIEKPSACKNLDKRRNDHSAIWSASLVRRVLKRFIERPSKGVINTPKYITELVMTLRNTGMTYASIADHLNEVGLANHQGRDWNYEAVKKVVYRYYERQQIKTCFTFYSI
jgi:hypothetical protein